MKPYLERVITEKTELDSKRAKLKDFITGAGFHGIAPEEQDRLKRQLNAMDTYSQILSERIQYGSAT